MTIEVEEGSLLNRRRTRWLVECKHFANSDKSVTPHDIGSIVEKCLQHKVDGYLLVTSTMPSTNLQDQLDSINNNDRFPMAKCWKKNKLAGLVIERPQIFQKYFPKSFEKYFGSHVTVSESDLRTLFHELYNRMPEADEIRSIIFNAIKFGISEIDTIKRIITDPEVNKTLKDVYNRLLLRAPDPTGLFVYGWWYKNLPEDKRLSFIQQSIKTSPEYKTPIEVRLPSDVVDMLRRRITCCLNCQARDSGEWVWVLGREYGLLSEMIDEVFEELHPEEFEKFSHRPHLYRLEESLTCRNCGTDLDVDHTVGEGEL